MRVEYINPFIKSLVETFDTMLQCKAERGSISLKEEPGTLHEVSGIIGLSGKAVGSVVVSLSREVALGAAGAMLMDEKSELDADVIDAIGEITNMVAGGAKTALEEYSLSMSLPNVITGKGHAIRFPSNVKPILVPFTTKWGDLAIEVGLEQVEAPATC